MMRLYDLFFEHSRLISGFEIHLSASEYIHQSDFMNYNPIIINNHYLLHELLFNSIYLRMNHILVDE